MQETNAPQPIPPPPSSHIPNTFLLFSIFSLLLIVISAAVTYLVLQSKQKNENKIIPTATIMTPSLSPTLTTPPSPSITVRALEPTGSDANAAFFQSANLGISFSYLKEQDGATISTLESGNKVYVFNSSTKPTDGQFVEVFTKDKDDTLADAIKKMFLAGKPESECFVKDYPLKMLPSNFVGAIISFPYDQNNIDLEKLTKMSEDCSKDYAQTNGIRYFLMDKNVQTKFLFFSIGQYGIRASENTSWQDTIKLY